MAFAEPGHRPVVRSLIAREPPESDVAVTDLFDLAGAGDPGRVGVEEDFEHHRRVVRGLAPTVVIGGVDVGEVEDFVDDLGDESGFVITGQPVGMTPEWWTRGDWPILGRRMRVETMPKNIYTDEFKADAVELYETHSQLSYSQAAADLGVSRGALKTWVHQARKAAGAVPTQPANGPDGTPETPGQELARLRVENTDLRDRQKRLRADIDRLEEEREILRKATKYFAAETTW